MRRIISLILKTVLLSFLYAAPVFANNYYDTSVLQCGASNNLAIVRIGGYWDEDPATYPNLPAALGAQWNKVMEASTTECRLANGERLAFKQGRGQAFAYGAGGASPPVWISLWLDNRILLSRFQVKAGHSDHDGRTVTSLIYTPGQLRICDVETDWAKYDKRPRPPVARDSDGCFIRAVKKATLPYDSLHNYNLKAEVGTISVMAVYSPAFCKRFVYPAQMFEKGPWYNAIVRGKAEVLSYVPLKAADLPINGYTKIIYRFDGMPDYRGDLSGRLSMDYFDFDNDGQQDTVIQASDDRNYMDGELFLVKTGRFPNGADGLKTAKDYSDWAKTNGWSVYSGLKTPYQTDRYTHFRAFRLNGATYLMATPARSEWRPSAVLYKPLPDGKIDAVCFYQVVEDKF